MSGGTGTGVAGEGLLALAKDVLASAGEAEAELYLSVAERGCARFAGGELGQHMQLSEPQAAIRVARGKRVAETVTSLLDRDALVEVVRATGRAAMLVPEEDSFPGFTGAGGDPPRAPSRHAAATARATRITAAGSESSMCWPSSPPAKRAHPRSATRR